MYDYVYIICAFVRFLDEPPVIICLNCHPGQEVRDADLCGDLIRSDPSFPTACFIPLHSHLRFLGAHGQ